MKVAIITVAGYQAGLMKDSRKIKKNWKAIYTEDNVQEYFPSLSSSSEVYSRIELLLLADINLTALRAYCGKLEPLISDKINLVFNKHCMRNLASGYSLFWEFRSHLNIA